MRQLSFAIVVLFTGCFSISIGNGKLLAQNDIEPKSVNHILHNTEDALIHEKLTRASVSELSNIVNCYPKDYYAHLLLGSCCDYLGLPEQANQQYHLAFIYGPDQPQAFTNLIKVLMKTGQLTAVSNLLKQAMQKFPTDPQIVLMTGNALYRQRNYKEAESLYRQAMIKNTAPALGLMTALASLRLEEGNYRVAFKLASEDLAYQKDFPRANEIAGLALMKMGQFERAIPYLKIAFKDDCLNYSIAWAYAKSLVWCGQYNDALLPSLCSLITAKTEQNKSQVRTLLDQTTADFSINAVKEASIVLGHYGLATQSADLHFQLAKIYLTKHQIDQAQTELGLAAKYVHQLPEVQYDLALILEAYKHDYLSALKYLREAHSLAPYNNEISRHLMRLEDRMNIRQQIFNG